MVHRGPIDPLVAAALRHWPKDHPCLVPFIRDPVILYVDLTRFCRRWSFRTMVLKRVSRWEEGRCAKGEEIMREGERRSR